MTPENFVRGSLKKRLQGLMLARLFLIILFLGATIWIQFAETKSALQPAMYPFYAIIVFVCLLTILYSVILSILKHYKRFTYIQLFLDVFIISLTLFLTGGIESPFSFLFILSIISAGIMLGRKAGFIVSSLSSLSYGLLLDFQFYNLPPWNLSFAPQVYVVDASAVLFNVFISIVAFFTVAALSGYLSEKLLSTEHELNAARIDYKRLESLSRGIIDNVSSGILTVDGKNRITSFNRAAEKITGLRLEDVYYKDVAEILPVLKKNGRGLDISHRVLRDEVVFKRTDGDKVYLGFSLSPFKDEKSGGSGAVMIFQDLTPMKKMEEDFRRNDRLRALGELAAGMAHEVRNPLASISGSIQVLKEDLRELSDEDKNLMEIILRETTRLNSLITDFLVFARPALKKRTVSLSSIAEDTINLLFSRSELKGIEVKKEFEDVSVYADPEQLKQVLWNLFLNAVEAMGEEGILSVAISGSKDKNEDRAMIEISDTGKGLDDTVAQRIFDPFYTTKESGTGMGLAVVYRIIEGHKGAIVAENKDDGGTTFRIELPVSG